MKTKQILIEKYIEPSETEVGGVLVRERWLDKYGDRHSLMGQPSEIWYENGQITEKRWHKKGILHRDKALPAETFYYNENIFGELWYQVIYYDNNRNLIGRHWIKK